MMPPASPPASSSSWRPQAAQLTFQPASTRRWQPQVNGVVASWSTSAVTCSMSGPPKGFLAQAPGCLTTPEPLCLCDFILALWGSEVNTNGTQFPVDYCIPSVYSEAMTSYEVIARQAKARKMAGALLAQAPAAFWLT